MATVSAYGVGATYAFGPGMVGLLWTHTKLQGAAFPIAGTNPAEAFGPLNARFDNIELNCTNGLTPALALIGNYT